MGKLSQQTTTTCDCCGDEVNPLLAEGGGRGFHQVKVSFDHGSLSKSNNNSKALDLCVDCLQFITGESLHGGQDKLSKALTFLVFKFVVDGLKSEAAKGRAGEADKEGGES